MHVIRFIPCFILLGCASSPGSVADAALDDSTDAVLDVAKEVDPGGCSLAGACCCAGDVRGTEPKCSSGKASCEIVGMPSSHQHHDQRTWLNPRLGHALPPVPMRLTDGLAHRLGWILDRIVYEETPVSTPPGDCSAHTDSTQRAALRRLPVCRGRLILAHANAEQFRPNSFHDCACPTPPQASKSSLIRREDAMTLRERAEIPCECVLR